MKMKCPRGHVVETQGRARRTRRIILTCPFCKANYPSSMYVFLEYGGNRRKR